ncbi:unnamed protein product [Urochloa humidicola]
MPRHLKDHAVSFSMAAFVSTATLLLGRAASAVLSLETRIVASFVASLVLVFLQYILAPMRRRSGRWFIKYGSKAAYYGPSFLAFYAANAVFSSIYHNTNEEPTPSRLLAMDFALTLLWLTLFSSSRAGANGHTITAYSLREAPSQRWRFVQWSVFLAFLNWQHRPLAGTGSRLYGIIPHIMLAILAKEAPESVMDCQTKAVADYMKRESKKLSSPPFFDGGNNSLGMMDFCRYPFMEKKDGRWISVKQLVQRDDLKHVEEDRDIWLSFSLSRLLARRYYGFHCAEEGDANVRAFALAELPSNCNRAFTIVEVQLAFFYDYFFTASSQWIAWDSSKVDMPWMMGQIYTSRTWNGVSMMVVFLSMRMGEASDFLGTRELVPLVSWGIFMLAGCVFMHVPINYHLPKYWGPVVIAFHTVNGTKTSLIERTAGHILSFIHRLGSIFKRCCRWLHANTNYDTLATSCVGPQPNEQDGPSQSSVYWRNKIGQYSLLQDYNRPRSLKKAATAWFQGYVLSQPSYSFITHQPVEEDDVPVPQSVRELVAGALVAMQAGGLPTNGTRSLHPYKDNLSWTCREETHTDTILIWHIATCYCGMLPPQGARQEGGHEPDTTVQWYHKAAKALSGYFAYLLSPQGAPQEEGHEPDTVEWYHEAATALSGYCAYLVAFLPEFLPEHSLTTKSVFQRVLQEAQMELARAPHIGAVTLPENPNVDTTFHKGVRLGRELEALHADDPRQLWKVIAEFWAETMVYIAPSDNAEVHMEHLAQGGEFITHVWALLSNAGILKRATQDYVPPPPDTAAPSSSSKGKGIAHY